MTSVGYGWAQPLVRDLCEAERRNIGFCLSADRATRFYILLALRGWQQQGKAAAAFATFARELATAPRRALLQQLWGADLGALTLLKNCSGFPWSKTAIDQFSQALAVKSIRRALGQQSRITPKSVRAWLQAPTEARSSDYVDLALRFGAEEIDYLLQGIEQQKLPLVRSDVIARLSKAKTKSDLEERLHRLLMDVALPPPPWLGTPTVIPLRTMGAVRQAGQLFSNCLTDCDYGFRTFCGNNVIYIAQVRGVHFCCQIKRDRLLRSWRVTEIKGPRNAKPTRAQHRIITGIFAEAGFPYLPKSVLEFWYD